MHLFIYCLIYDIVGIPDYAAPMVVWLVNGELERVWREDIALLGLKLTEEKHSQLLFRTAWIPALEHETEALLLEPNTVEFGYNVVKGTEYFVSL